MLIQSCKRLISLLLLLTDLLDCSSGLLLWTQNTSMPKLNMSAAGPTVSKLQYSGAV